MRTQSSWAGVGYSFPLLKAWLPMRQMNAGPSWPVPSVVKPASRSSSYPVVGVVSQPRTTGPPHFPKSTATMAPLVRVHFAIGSAWAAGPP